MTVLVIDNYDSFTYNLVQLVGELGRDTTVARSDEITVEDIADMQPSHIIISPGPGRPADAGVSNEVIRHFAKEIPILGVCLGHQCIAEAFGLEVVRAARLMHGKTSLIFHDGRGIFRGLPNPFVATRYHSLIAQLPRRKMDASEKAAKNEAGFEVSAAVFGDVEVTAWTVAGSDVQAESIEVNAVEIMGIRHRRFPVEGVQFHPESILTKEGRRILSNFLEMRAERIVAGGTAYD